MAVILHAAISFFGKHMGEGRNLEELVADGL